MTTPAAQDKPSARRTTVVASKEDDDPRPANEETVDTSLTLVPVLLNGQKHSALLDSGADRSLISKSLVDELGATVEPKEGSIQLADASTIPRIGVTSPIRTQTGSLDTPYRYEVIPELAGTHLFIGNDLINRVVGPDYLAGKFTLPSTTDDAPAHVVDAPTPLAPSDANKEEGSSEFQAFPETVVQAIVPEPATNATISHTFPPLNSEGGSASDKAAAQQQSHQRTSAAPRYGLQHGNGNDEDSNRHGHAPSPHGAAKGPTRGHHPSPPLSPPPRTIASPTTATPRRTILGSLRPTLTTKRPSPATGIAEANRRTPPSIWRGVMWCPAPH